MFSNHIFFIQLSAQSSSKSNRPTSSSFTMRSRRRRSCILWLTSWTEVSCSPIWERSTGSRSRGSGFMLQSSLKPWATCTREACCTEIWSQRMCSSTLTATSASLILVSLRSIWEGRIKPFPSVEHLSILPRKLFLAKVIHTTSIGGHSAQYSMKCSLGTRRTTVETSRRCWGTSFRSQYPWKMICQRMRSHCLICF